MRVVVTRPEPECSRWVEAMRLEGLSAVALPLIEIASIPFVFDATQNYDAFVFVSRSAVDGFLKSQSIDALQAKRCLVTGPGTAASLIQHGLREGCLDQPDNMAGQFDSEALWRVVGARAWTGKRVLVVRGSDQLGASESASAGRNWLADQLTAVGASVDFLVSYQRRLPVISSAGHDLLQANQDVASKAIWLFSSSQAIQHLKLIMPTRDWSQCSALATHPRIQIAAYGAGFGKVGAVRPVLADVIAALLSD